MPKPNAARDFNAKRKREREEAGGVRKRRPKSFKRQESYHSSSEDEGDVQINLQAEKVPEKPEEFTGGNSAELGKRVKRAPLEERIEVVAVPVVVPVVVAVDANADANADAQGEEEDADEEEEEERDDEDAIVDAPETLGDVDGGVQLGSDDDEDDEPDLDAIADDESAEDDEDEDDAASDSDTSLSETSSRPASQKRKRNDPTIFATSISKILDSKLTTTKRADPVLSRSKAATEASQDLAESRLEAKARRKLREDKRSAMEKGRVRDVLGLESAEVSTGEIAEHERKLRKMAQRGVVKLFNAVRAAQVKGEEAARAVGSIDTDKHIIGGDGRKERVNEMSKKGFLDMLVGGET
jgi:fusion and transport protein UGO1